MYAADDVDGGLKLFVGGQQLDKKLRRDILEAVRGGEPVPDVEFEATTYIQRPTPNRNFVRFKNSILTSFAKSYKASSAPFLKNHDTYDTASRGGTCIDSSCVKAEDVASFIMRTKCASLSAPWAALGILDGTIDRFSIAWSRTGPVECSIHKCPVFTECDCYPGDMLGEDVCEFVFTAADGTEYSGVNVPAVVGTGISAITKLAALDRRALKHILGVEATSPPPKKEHTMDPKLLALLGLTATATPAEVETAFALYQAKQRETATALATAQTELATREASERKTVIDTSIASLCASGKIQPGGEVERSLRGLAEVGATVPDPVLRSQALRSSLELFCSQVKALSTAPSVTPAGAPIPAATPDPVKPAAPAAAAGVVPNGKDFLSANPTLAGWLRRAGITHEQFEKHGALGREYAPQMFIGARQ